MQPLEIVKALPWQQAIFTTYALSLSFFEAVVLDQLVRGGGRNALILADPEGIRAALSEQGARRAGRDYEVEPFACTSGVFHPKMSIFLTDRDAHMLVGSGNLTFGGWGMNLETVEHVHPSFAAEAFDDASEMFELMAIADNLKTGIGSQLAEIAFNLRKAATDAPRSGNIRLLHSVGGSIGEQLAVLANELGGATRLTVVSPYFDQKGTAISRLATSIGCEDVRIHVHPCGPVRGLTGTSWPDGSVGQPYCVETFAEDERPLHGKCFEIVCRRGRLIMSGSANATTAALYAGNVEASLVRIQRETLLGWNSAPSCKPTLPDQGEAEVDDEADTRIGILRAVLEGERVAGQVMVPRMKGAAHLSVVRTAGYDDLGEVLIDSEGKFEAVASDLEMQSWSGGRIVLRVTQGEQVAEGFVSVAAAAKIMQRAGPLAPRLLAMLAGSETPEDVAAILTWFGEDPNRIASAAPGGGHRSEKGERSPSWVSIDELRAAGNSQDRDDPNQPGTELAWQRALSLVRSAFTAPRGPWKSEAAEDDQTEEGGDRESDAERQKRLKREANGKQSAMKALDGLLDVMLAERHQGRYALSAFALTHYLADRARPAPIQVQKWLARILSEFSRFNIELDDAAATAGLLIRATDGQHLAAMRARRYLIHAGIDPSALNLDCESIPGYIETLGPTWDAEAFLAEVDGARTPGEQVRIFLASAQRGEALPQLPLLESSPHWPKLILAYSNKKEFSNLIIIEKFRKACPKCNIVLPTAHQQELQQTGVTSHCRVILSREL
jgi:hypothetical protein